MPNPPRVALNKRVQLINPPLMSTLKPGIRAGAYPPLHLASLAAFLRERCPTVGVEVIDGELYSIDEILSRVDADLVGISCNSLTYEPALQIAGRAKAQGALVVLGGAHPTFSGKLIVKNRPFVDAVVYGDGELALMGLVNGSTFPEIPNLIYRHENNICVNAETKLRLDDLPLPDYTGLPLDRYFNCYKALYPDKPFQRPLSAYSSKGCQWRDRAAGGCTFCAIQHIGFRIKPAAQYWKELLSLHRDYNADFFWDVSDTFTMQREWVRQFAAQRPPGTDFKFQVYGRASDIDDELARLLADIGVYEVFLGLESGSNETLKASRKGISVRSNLKAVANLNHAGVRVVVSVILGLPNESDDTLAATMGMVEDLLSTADLSEINCSILMPLPGSRLMKELSERIGIREEDQDLFDPESLRRAWVEGFCDVGYERLMEVQGQMRRLHRRVGTFGLTVSENAFQTQGQSTGTGTTLVNA